MNSNNDETKTNESEKPLVGEALPKSKDISEIYRKVIANRELREAEKKKQKKDNKNKSGKSKKELDLELYDDYISNYSVRYPNSFNPFLREQSRFREGNVIPEELELNLYNDSGFFFGRKFDENWFVGKPANEDGHILVAGIPGSGKTMGIVIPTMMTWRGIQIIVDVKGDLYRYWILLNKHTGKKAKLFSPSSPKGCSCWYDPYAPLRHGGSDNLAGNARDLALALMPLISSVKDPVWIQAAQSFLTGAIIYYFSLGTSFIETMAAIQLSSITDMIAEIMSDDNISAKAYMSKLSDVQEKVIGNIGMELSKLATLVTDPAIINAFSPNDENCLLDWAELNTTKEPFDVILEIPEVNLERWEPMTLLMINQLIKSLEQRSERTYEKEEELPPVLVMLDEFPRLGNISAIKNGLQTLRSRGVTFALFVQSFANLDETYGAVAARIIADICAYKIVLGVGDPASQEYFSRAVGTTESTLRSVSVNHDPLSGKTTGYGRNINESREPILYPEEFLTLRNIVVINPYNGFCRVNKTLFIDYKETFLMPQLLQNRDYAAQHPITYSYDG